MDRENWIEFLNIITMDDENIEKFKKLYGEGEQHLICEVLVDTKISFSMIIPEPAKNGSDKNWVDNSRQDIWSFRHFAEEEKPEPVGRELEIWRYENWGTPSNLLYDSLEGPDIRSLEGLLKGEYGFYTFGKPPFKVYEKMAADGLVFSIKWYSPYEYDEWVIGKGQVVEGRFQYHAGPITGDEIMSIESLAHKFITDPKNGPNNKPTIVVKNREHLDQLLEELRENIKTNLYMQGKFSLINKISGNTIILNSVLNLNFLDITNVSDLSNLSEYLDVSPCPDNGWFCKIKLDTSKWKK